MPSKSAGLSEADIESLPLVNPNGKWTRAALCRFLTIQIKGKLHTDSSGAVVEDGDIKYLMTQTFRELGWKTQARRVETYVTRRKYDETEAEIIISKVREIDGRQQAARTKGPRKKPQ